MSLGTGQPPIIIRPYRDGDGDGVIALILGIQQREFGVAISLDDQPDLLAIPSFYQCAAGGFWVAERSGQIVGTIALKDFGERQAALRKMFVASHVRGAEHGVAIRLLGTLIAHARTRGMETIYLGTTDAFRAAHRFYEKTGFVEVDPAMLPDRFPRMPVDNKFYRLACAAFADPDQMT